MLVDSHCHLNMAELKDDLEAILANAAKHDVKYMQTICTKMADFAEIIKISEEHEHIYASIGVHPNEVAGEALIEVADIVEKAKHRKIIGIGETGLDFYYENSARDIQIESFKRHIIVAQQTKLPIIIHSRAADEETIDVLTEMMNKAPFTGLIHCFSTDYKLAKAAIDLGLYVSIAGIVTFKNAKDLQESVKKIPLSKLLVETDAPYLAPTPMRGKRNEPAFTKYTAEFIADLKNISYSDVAETTTDNFFKLFNKAKLALDA